jgi:hypothetical protein
MGRLLLRYAAALKTPLAKAGAFNHRYQMNGLLHAEPIDGRRAKPRLSTALLFKLILFTRVFTNAPARAEIGGAMPNSGRPLWPIAVAFLGEALGEYATEKEAKDRLDKLIERNPGIGWGGWVDPPYGVCRYSTPRHLAMKIPPKRRG